MIPNWLAFIAAGILLAVLTPLGEGIDEPAHFAHVQYVAQSGRLPLGQSRGAPDELDAFLRNQPTGWSLYKLYPGLLSHDDYWKKSPQERDALDHTAADLKFSRQYSEPDAPIIPQYESHQPPLYYVLTLPVFFVASSFLSFLNTFLVTRLWSVLLASLIVPGTYLLARHVIDDKAARLAATLVVLFPGLYPGVIRVSNDALAVPLACWLFVFLISFVKTDRRADLYALCGLMVAGLWTKAFFIPILAATVLTLMGYRKIRAALIVLVVSLAGLPWYVFAFLKTGSLTGLPETVSANTSLTSSFAALLPIDWFNAFSVLRSSHIWIGNASLLGVRSWMYQVIFWLFILALAGLVVQHRRVAFRTLAPLLGCYAVFGLALAYYATQVFQATGTSVVQGWYLTMFIPIEATLFIEGVRAWFPKQWTRAVGVFAIFLFALMVYSAAFVEWPYYAGLTSHRSDGAVSTYHFALQDLSRIPSRLLRFY